MIRSRLFRPAVAVSAALCAGITAAAAPIRRPAPRPANPNPVRSAAKPPAVTAATLGPVLKSLGYAPVAEGGFQRLQIEEPEYQYTVDASITRSGDWLVCTAHLAPVGDLTKLPSAPLLGLLSTNDSLLGMYFSYDRAGAQIILNATVPVRALDGPSLRNVIEGLKTTVREKRGLWDTKGW